MADSGGDKLLPTYADLQCPLITVHEESGMKIAVVSALFPPVIAPPRAVCVGEFAYGVGKPRVLISATVRLLHGKLHAVLGTG